MKRASPAWNHRLACFETKVASSISPQMRDGEYLLSDEHGLFYLCGVGQADAVRRGRELARKVTNVHLPVRPRRGSVAAIGSVYGVTLTIKDAQAIPIEPVARRLSEPTGEALSVQELSVRLPNVPSGYSQSTIRYGTPARP
jgi:hypothetical protein